MSLVRFLVMLSVGTLLSWVAWVMVLTNMNPTANGLAAVSLFYLSLILALTGTVTMIGFFLRYWLEKEKLPFRQIAISFRQATLLSIGVGLALLLQSGRLLRWWSILMLVLVVGILEIFFLLNQSRRTRINQ